MQPCTELRGLIEHKNPWRDPGYEQFLHSQANQSLKPTRGAKSSKQYHCQRATLNSQSPQHSPVKATSAERGQVDRAMSPTLYYPTFPRGRVETAKIKTVPHLDKILGEARNLAHIAKEDLKPQIDKGDLLALIRFGWEVYGNKPKGTEMSETDGREDKFVTGCRKCAIFDKILPWLEKLVELIENWV
ncbi:hypothetical protein GE09DRAFT_1143485, partial [Coniochaeta sp. 2T2.1]